ncbi:L-2-amino-thiazoline-4-carboxylic acid hydrolase [bacterium]|nr:L-2-amino-thiazoline-4-carboxylic acid hydrolase [candidate division CSSED10-310 bacterium]
MNIGSILGRYGLAPEELRYAEIMINGLRKEIGLLLLPAAMARVLSLSQRPAPVRTDFDTADEYHLAELEHRYAPLVPAHAAIAGQRGVAAADRVVGDMLVEIAVLHGRDTYPPVTGETDYGRFLEIMAADKAADPYMRARPELAEGELRLRVDRCLYIEAVERIGLSSLVPRMCDTYEAYCEACQPLVEAFLVRAMGRGDHDCLFGYRRRR